MRAEKGDEKNEIRSQRGVSLRCFFSFSAACREISRGQNISRNRYLIMYLISA